MSTKVFLRRKNRMTNEKKYAILNVACNRPYTNEKGKTVADFISLKVWKDPEKLVNEL